MTSDLYYILPSGHSLADKEAIAFSDVLNENFIILDRHFVHLNAFNIWIINIIMLQRHSQTDDINLLKRNSFKKIGIKSSFWNRYNKKEDKKI